MRRKEKEIIEKDEIEQVIRKSRICRIGLCDGGKPYIVPVCFGYKDGALYFHCASAGRKLEIMDQNNSVCFEMESDVEFLKSETACKWSLKYRSIIGTGRANRIQGYEDKLRGFQIIMKNYSDDVFSFNEESVKKNCNHSN